ncbi:hypothetical protein [Singulisphaera sp. PoT]|uniref:hypothetical protein n=1 Tax=Singulisphaera sp. PoT TaxID=3411797 RepID=UPI003BF60144
MERRELALLVRKMRQAQNTFYRTRRPEDLETSKRLERKVDLECGAIIDQPLLFGNESREDRKDQS